MKKPMPEIDMIFQCSRLSFAFVDAFQDVRAGGMVAVMGSSGKLQVPARVSTASRLSSFRAVLSPRSDAGGLAFFV